MKKLTVTIGIPAYNESKKIRKLLRSVISQNENNYVLESVIVVSDGSTDKTVAQARKVCDKRIKVISERTNKGRIYRRNQLLNMCKTDIFVFLDADGTLEHQDSLSYLIAPFYESKSMALASGNPHYSGKNTFFHKSLRVASEAYHDIRFQINEGHNVFGCFGSFLAISRKLYRGLVIPMDIDADDSYIYFVCKQKGYEFRNVDEAWVLHSYPKSVKAHVARNTRYSRARPELKKYFGKKVDKEFTMPRSLYRKVMLKKLLRYPVYSIVIYSLNTYTRLIARYGKN